MFYTLNYNKILRKLSFQVLVNSKLVEYLVIYRYRNKLRVTYSIYKKILNWYNRGYS